MSARSRGRNAVTLTPTPLASRPAALTNAAAAALLLASTATRFAGMSTYHTGVSRVLWRTAAASSFRLAARRSRSVFFTTTALAPWAWMAGTSVVWVVATTSSCDVVPRSQAPAKRPPRALRSRPARVPASASLTSRRDA